MKWYFYILPLMLLVVSPLRGAQRNVVLMVVDDQGLQAGCYGDRVIQTPSLDKLASAGTRFNYAFCTTASCSASRSVILTGLINHTNAQYGHQHGVSNFHTYRWVRSLPRLLSEAGYRTCVVGKYHVQPREVYPFDKFANKGLKGGYRSVAQMANNAEKFIRENDERPFFLYFCPSDPHRARKGFANDRNYPGVKPIKYDPKDIPIPYFLPDTPEARKELAEFYQSISRADQGLGFLMEVLKKTGHWGDTLLIYLSDNGPPFPGAKTTLYEPGMRLPLVVRSPGQEKLGVVCNALTTFADITPTILEYAGVKGPNYPLAGRSFLSVLEKENPLGWDEVYASHTFHQITMYYPMRVIRTRKYKYILNLAHQLPFPFASDLYESETWQGVLKRGDKTYGQRSIDAYVNRPRHELYDLEKDPQETVNLAESPEHAKILSELQAKLRVWQKETKDPWLIKYEYE